MGAGRERSSLTRSAQYTILSSSIKTKVATAYVLNASEITKGKGYSCRRWLGHFRTSWSFEILQWSPHGKLQKGYGGLTIQDIQAIQASFKFKECLSRTIHPSAVSWLVRSIFGRITQWVLHRCHWFRLRICTQDGPSERAQDGWQLIFIIDYRYCCSAPLITPPPRLPKTRAYVYPLRWHAMDRAGKAWERVTS